MKKEPPLYDPAELIDLARLKMPYGRHQGKLLVDLPEPYVLWMARQGFPRGRLGRLLQALHEIKVNGLESLLDPFRAVEPDEGKKRVPGPR